jgi:hypothetical protein
MQQNAPAQPITSPQSVAQPPVQQQAEPPAETAFDRYQKQIDEIRGYKAQVLRNAANIASRTSPEYATGFMARTKDQLETEYPTADLKPFDQSEQYKNANDDAKELKKKAAPMLQLGKQLQEVESLLATGDPRDKEHATSLIKMGSLKNINSLVSPDAVSVGEAMLRYRMITDAFEINALQNAGATALKGFILKLNDMPQDKLQAEWEKYKSGEQSMFTMAKNALQQASSADPERFHTAAASIYNSVAEPYNERVKDIEQRTSPMHLKDHFGLQPTILFKPEKTKQAIPDQVVAPPTTFGGSSTLNTGSRDIGFQGAPAMGVSTQPAAQPQAQPQRRTFGSTKFSILNP